MNSFFGQDDNFDLTSLFGRRRKSALRTSDYISIFSTLKILIKQSVPIEEALQIISETNHSEYIKIFSAEVRNQIVKGYKLSDSVRMFDPMIDEMVLAILIIGQKRGELCSGLDTIVKYFEGKQRGNRRIIKAIAYPCFVSFSALLTFVFYKFYIFDVSIAPIIASLESSIESPLFSIVLALERGHVVAFITAVGLMLFLSWLVSEPLSQFFALIMHRRPSRYNIYAMGQELRYLRTVEHGLAGDLMPLDALKLATDSVYSTGIKAEMEASLELVEQGVSPLYFLETVPFMSKSGISVIRSGFTTGELREAIETASELVSNEMENAAEKIEKFLEPLALTVSGILVLGVGLVMLVPTLTMLNSYQ